MRDVILLCALHIMKWFSGEDLMVGTLEEEELLGLNVQQLEYRQAALHLSSNQQISMSDTQSKRLLPLYVMVGLTPTCCNAVYWNF